MRIAALLLLSAATGLASPIALDRMELDLTVNYEEARIDGSATLTVINLSDAPTTTVPLILGRLMAIKTITADGAPAPFDQDVLVFEDDSTRQTLSATVKLPKPLAPRAKTTLAIAYGGHVVGYTETGQQYVRDRIADDYSMIRSDAYAFPILSPPSIKEWRAMPRRDFTFDARINVPEGYVVAAGGQLIDTKKDGGRTAFHFASDVPAPFLNIGIAKFSVLDEKGVRIYYLPKDEAGAKIVMERTQKALNLFGTWFGPLPQPPRFTIIEIPEGWGAQASLVAGIILEADAFQAPSSFMSLYHEVGHFWNVPDLDVPSPRWNEGLSTWFQEVVSDAVDGKPNPKFAPWIVERTRGRIAKEPKYRTVALKDYGKEEMTDASYNVGYLYFHVLEKVLGRDEVLRVLSEYFQARKTSGGTLRDFVTLLESRHPRSRAISAEWIESPEWAHKLAATKSIDDVVAGYARAEKLISYLRQNAKTPEDYVVSKFEDHDIVFLGEFHRIKHDLLLVQRLIPRLHAAGVYNLGIEIADSDAQAEVDALITADRYDEERVRAMAFRYDGSWGYREYLDLYRAAWELNHSLPPAARKFRIVHLGYRANWREVTEDPETRRKAWHRGDPDRFMGDVALKEFVDKGEKALVYSGSHHAFTRYQQPYFDEDAKKVGYNDHRLGNIVYQKIGDRAFNIFLHSPWQAKDYEGPWIRPASGEIDAVMPLAGLTRAGFDVKGSPFGEIGGSAAVYTMGYPDFTLATFCDGYIYQGPFRIYEGVAVDPRYITTANFQDAVDRLANPRARKFITTPERLVQGVRESADMKRRFRDLQ